MSSPRPFPFAFELVDYDDPRAAGLRDAMDDEMAVRYRDPDSPVMPEAVRLALVVDTVDIRFTVLVLDASDEAVGHAALRLHGGEWEVKRVIVRDDQRGRGVGRALLVELDRLAIAGGAQRLILQCGDRQPEAVALYTSSGYTPIPVYEPYLSAIPNSLCFGKSIAT